MTLADALTKPVAAPAAARPVEDASTRERRAIAYIARMPPAISGAGGHDATWSVARKLAADFDLGEEATFRILRDHYNSRCEPPWTERELRHKARDAAERARIRNPVEDRHWDMPTSHYSAPTPAAVDDSAPLALPRIGVADIFAPLPPVPWLVQSLDLCPGAPALVAGYGFSGKTAAAQCMGVEIAAGLPVWGAFSARRGRVLHVDYEQGRRLTLERYQRLAAAHLVTPDELAGRLEVIVMPPVYLDAPNAEEVFLRECEGVDLLIIDSLRAACPTLEENASEIRRALDVLGRISEQTGTTCIVVHHARKPSIDKAGGARMAIRGSGAIFDACSSVLCFDGEKGQPTRVSHEKARTSGITAEDFELVIADVEIDGDARAGLSVAAQGAAPVAMRASAAAHSRVSADATTVAHVLLEQPGIGVRELRAHVRARTGAGSERTDAALAYLGPAVVRGTGARGARPMTLDVEQLPAGIEVSA